MMPTPPVVPSGLGFRLVLQVVASQVLEVVASHMVTNVVVVVLVVVVVFVLVLQDLLVLLALLLEIRPGHCLRVVLGAVVGQILMMLLQFQLFGALPEVFRAHFVGGTSSSRLSLVVLSVACTGVGEGAGSCSSTSIKEGASSSGSASEEIADGEFDRGPSSSVFGAVVSEEVRGRGGSPPTSARSVRTRARPLSAIASSVA